MSDKSETNKRKWFVGPANVSWWKFKIAGIVWKMTRGSGISFIGKIPASHRAAMWAFQVRVMSRDFEEVDINE